MLRNEPLLNALLINLLLGTIWHYATFFLCISIKIEHFDSKRARYQPRKWEKNGKWYADHLKINKWKDFLPQHIGKDGFSKDHLDDVSIEYLDEFILEKASCNGYIFIGWYLNSDCSGDPVTNITEGTTGDLRLYAKWVKE